MNVEIMENIKFGHYHAVKSLVSGNKNNDDKLLFMAFDTDSVALYVYRCFLILENETAFLHEKASQIMNIALLHYTGYYCGIMHERRMLKLVPNSVTYLSHLLYDNHIPDHLVLDDEAYQISLQILSIDPLHEFARKTKENIELARLRCITESKQYIPHDDEYPEFIKLIHTGFYEEAKNILQDYTIDQIATILHILMDRHQSVALYTYAFFMLLDQETARGHVLAGRLLLQLKSVCGAQSGALFHARRAVELEPHSLQTLAFLLSFYTLSEPLLSDDEACVYAQQLLAIDPEHAMALEMMQKLKK